MLLPRGNINVCKAVFEIGLKTEVGCDTGECEVLLSFNIIGPDLF